MVFHKLKRLAAHVKNDDVIQSFSFQSGCVAFDIIIDWIIQAEYQTIYYSILLNYANSYV